MQGTSMFVEKMFVFLYSASESQVKIRAKTYQNCLDTVILSLDQVSLLTWFGYV